MARTFVVARNPEPDTTLPYLLRLPLPDGDLVLKAKDTWPRTAKVYCHRVDGWPDEPDLVEEVPVRSCVRRGVAIDLVLDRYRENRSQLVFTQVAGGREGIFWQTAGTRRAVRLGTRVGRSRASGVEDLHVLIDTRERYPYKFVKQQATTARKALRCGDYGVELDGVLVASVERKSLSDLASSLLDGRLTTAMAELTDLPRAAVVVEDPWSAVFKLTHVQPGVVADLVAAAQVRYPNVPIAFCETRPLAEEWVFRFLGAAVAHLRAS